MNEALAWFYGTHELTADFSRVWWRRTCLPAAGGYGDQDALMMAQIEYVQQRLNHQLARDAAKPATPQKDLTQD